MNNLSWAIYGLDVLEKSIQFIGVMIGVIFSLLVVYSIIFIISLFDNKQGGDNPYGAFKKPLSKKPFLVGIVGALLVCINIILPNQDTAKMIIASEVSEQGIDKLIEMSKDEKSIVFKGIKKLESILEVEK